jgi:cold shock CspA family protein
MLPMNLQTGIGNVMGVPVGVRKTMLNGPLQSPLVNAGCLGGVALPGLANSPQMLSQSRANMQKLASLVGQKLRGTIRSWKEDWGFLVSTKFDGDLFVHRQSLMIQGDPTAGRTVSFTVAIDQRNRPTAVQVTEPSPAPDDFAGGERLTGTVRSWRRDWGFIRSEQHFEGDLFCHQEQLEPADSFLRGEVDIAQTLVNNMVSFEVMVDQKNRAHAAKVRLVDQVTGGDQVLPPQLSGSMDVGSLQSGSGMVPNFSQQLAPSVGGEMLTGQSQMFGTPAKQEPGLSGNNTERFQHILGQMVVGSVRSWKGEWGFLVAPEAYEGDLFCHRGNLQNGADSLKVGAKVQYEVNIDPRGRATALSVLCIGEPEDLAGSGEQLQGQSQATHDNLLGSPAEQHEPVAMNGNCAERFQHILGQPIVGSVRSWKGEWGFLVAPEAYEGDLFCHRGNLQNGAEILMVGARVQFEVNTDTRGRATALNVTCLSEPKDWAGTGVQLQGQIRSFREPWGFLVAPGGFVGDLFFHLEHMDPGLRQFVQTGLQVSFNIEVDKNGRHTAMNIQLVPAIKRGLPGVVYPTPLKRPRM